TDYTVAGSTVTLTNAAAAGDDIAITYAHGATAGESIRVDYALATGSGTAGTITFDEFGDLYQINNAAPAAVTAAFGGGALTIAADLTALTQLAGDDGDAAVLNANGCATGTLEDITVDSVGRIIGSYSNDRTVNLAQVALADCRNEQGLAQNGESYYTATANSGEMYYFAAGDENTVAIMSSCLEASNVDTATEIVAMIAYQRSYQLNSRGISTANEMLKTAIDLKS
ncbi:MAG TPA: flagellar hook-basal body complex protein, partial [bacterium]|nr:flagellar hook-basal body complex protein [bacterium]